MKLINADDLLKAITDYPYGYRGMIKSVIDNQPAVDAEPVRHGYWIKNDNGTYSCSECQSWIPNEQHYYARYCLFCGAKMDGKDNG